MGIHLYPTRRIRHFRNDRFSLLNLLTIDWVSFMFDGLSLDVCRIWLNIGLFRQVVLVTIPSVTVDALAVCIVCTINFMLDLLAVFEHHRTIKVTHWFAFRSYGLVICWFMLLRLLQHETIPTHLLETCIWKKTPPMLQ